MAFGALRASSSDALLELVSKGKAQQKGGLHYAGDISTKEACEFLQNQGGFLVDVRTAGEWQTTGTPDLPGQSAMISWKTSPLMQLNPSFFDELASANIDKDAPVFFLCRTGGRSLDAAVEATARGYAHAFNIEWGYEGEPNAAGERCVVNGWKSDQLPCKKV